MLAIWVSLDRACYIVGAKTWLSRACVSLRLFDDTRWSVVYRQLIITIFRMPIYPMLNKANDPEYWLLIGRESGQVSHEY